MSATFVLLWLGSGAAQPALEPDLDAWARARWVEIEEPRGDAPSGLGYDDSVAKRAEELLEQARIAAGSLDDAGARARLAEVEALLRKHAELPQAAWLMAERWYVDAGVAAHTADGASASAALEARAEVLEGPRAEPFGASAQAAPELETTRVTLAGVRPRDRVYWDGELVKNELTTAVGEHHARVVRRERVIWAGFVRVVAAAPSVKLAVPRPVPCSLDDLEGARVKRGVVEAPADVRCARWIAARPAAKGGVEVATCHHSSCGPLIRWQRRMGEIYAGPPQPPPEPGWPTWATWAIAGASAAVVGGVVLWQSGAFDEPAAGHQRWVFSGPN